MKIKDTIRKLLALSNSPNENEAQSALLKAQELLARHHLTMADVEDAPASSVEEMDGDKKAHRSPWKRALASLIAHNFRCELYYRGHDSYKAIFVGKEQDLAVCKEVYTAAIRFIDLYFAQYWNNEGKWNLNGTMRPLSDSIREKSSYAFGFMSGLKARFQAQKVQAEKEGWGLVLVKDKDVVEYMGAKVFSGKLGVNPTSISSDAYYQGNQDCRTKFGDTGLKHLKD